MIPYGKQWVDKKDRQAVVAALQGDWLTQGPTVKKFEERMARYCAIPFALAVSSGTAALHLAYLGAGISAGDEVITTPLTFAATSNALLYIDAKPVFADINPDTLTIDPKQIERKLTKKTKAIAVVDFAGHPCDYRQIMAFAKRHNLLVIADGAHALGSEYNGARVGSIADVTTFSFHPVKIITTGEGGMLVTKDRAIYERAALLRHHGMIKKPRQGGWYYEIHEPGFNYRVTDLQCALGLSQLKKLPAFIKKRRAIVAIYNKAFENIPELITPPEQPWAVSAWHLYVIQLRLEGLRCNRRVIFDELQRKGICRQQAGERGVSRFGDESRLEKRRDSHPAASSRPRLPRHGQVHGRPRLLDAGLRRKSEIHAVVEAGLRLPRRRRDLALWAH